MFSLSNSKCRKFVLHLKKNLLEKLHYLLIIVIPKTFQLCQYVSFPQHKNSPRSHKTSIELECPGQLSMVTTYEYVTGKTTKER